MNLKGNQLSSILKTEYDKNLATHVNSVILSIENKIIIATRSGIDFVWFEIPSHYKYTDDEVCANVVKILEQNHFYVRLFETKNKTNVVQVIW